MLAASFDTELQELPIFQDMIQKADVLDAHAYISRLRNTISDIVEKSQKQNVPVTTGRKKYQDPADIKTLKLEIKNLAANGSDVASAALEKMKQDSKADEGEADKHKGKRKKRRVARKKKNGGCRLYKRAKGDEMRLIKKREIAPWLIILSGCSKTIISFILQ